MCKSLSPTHLYAPHYSKKQMTSVSSSAAAAASYPMLIPPQPYSSTAGPSVCRLATPTRNTHSLSISFSSATTPLLLPALWAIFTFLALTEMNDLVWGAVRGASTKLCCYTLSSILSILSKLATLPHPVCMYVFYVQAATIAAALQEIPRLLLHLVHNILVIVVMYVYCNI